MAKNKQMRIITISVEQKWWELFLYLFRIKIRKKLKGKKSKVKI